MLVAGLVEAKKRGRPSNRKKEGEEVKKDAKTHLIVIQNQGLLWTSSTDPSSASSFVLPTRHHQHSNNNLAIKHEIFFKAAEHAGRDFLWKDIFEKMACNNFRKGIRYYPTTVEENKIGVLVFKTRIKEFRCLIGKEPEEVYQKVREFLGTHIGLVSEQEQQVMDVEFVRSCEERIVEYLGITTFSSVKSEVTRNILLRHFAGEKLFHVLRMASACDLLGDHLVVFRDGLIRGVQKFHESNFPTFLLCESFFYSSAKEFLLKKRREKEGEIKVSMQSILEFLILFIERTAFERIVLNVLNEPETLKPENAENKGPENNEPKNTEPEKSENNEPENNEPKNAETKEPKNAENKGPTINEPENAEPKNAENKGPTINEPEKSENKEPENNDVAHHVRAIDIGAQNKEVQFSPLLEAGRVFFLVTNGTSGSFVISSANAKPARETLALPAFESLVDMVLQMTEAIRIPENFVPLGMRNVEEFVQEGLGSSPQPEVKLPTNLKVSNGVKKRFLQFCESFQNHQEKQKTKWFNRCQEEIGGDKPKRQRGAFSGAIDVLT